jgi:adenosylhomocysteine nucleosidase
MIALISALDEEIRDFRRGMSIRRISSYQCCRFYEGRLGNRDIILALSGMGGEHAKQVSQLILATYPVEVLISTGFCGSLNGKTGPGDMVVYSRSLNGEAMSGDRKMGELLLDPVLAKAAIKTCGKMNCRTLVGSGVTVSKVCSAPEDKRRLGQEYAADVVDMESYAIGQISLEKKTPFIAVRAVFDNIQDDLSVLEDITHGGKVAPWKLFSQVLAHPLKTKRLIQYGSNSRMARKNLSIFLCSLIEGI